MGERVTIQEVAARAQVSAATVSRVLSGSLPTSAGARAKVLRAVRDLDYVVNAHARALAGTGRKTVAVLTRNVTSPFFSQVAQGVENEATARGRLCIVCTTGNDIGREHELVQMLREQGAEMVVLVGGAVEDDEYRERMARYAQALAAVGSRLVLCGRPAPPPEVPAVVVEYDNEAGAYGITSHLLTAGHRRIVFLGQLPGNSTSEDRIAGYRKALGDFGLPPEAARVVGTGFNKRQGYETMNGLLEAGKPDFTAVFAGDDEVAAGAMKALRKHGLSVPDDISLIGYNDDPVADDLTPGLTTVHIPAEEMGRAAVRLALREEQGPGQERHLLGTHIVVRKSVGRPA
ncbi:LacI family DNA-binding transcriptional regulator [Streptomyces sp. NPDC057137]|uniref:LacI family DNA-binding transcriptional regulator n=1 Tax=Streptomyces sp. NPDC057137 TaxID=3346030 RepID=UPI003633B8D7